MKKISQLPITEDATDMYIDGIKPDGLDGQGNPKYKNYRVQADKISVYDLIIRTQAEFEALIADPTWSGAKSVAFVGQFELSTANNSGVKRPANVTRIDGYNDAKITVTNFAYDTTAAKGGLWDDGDADNQRCYITDLTVDCTGTDTGTGTSRKGYGFNGNNNTYTNCTGTGTGASTGTDDANHGGNGFSGNNNTYTNCTGTGTSTLTGTDTYGGYGFTGNDNTYTDCTGTGTATHGGQGFRGNNNTYTNCTGTGTGNYGSGFKGDNNTYTNCTGTGTGGSSCSGFSGNKNTYTNCTGTGTGTGTDSRSCSGFSGINNIYTNCTGTGIGIGTDTDDANGYGFNGNNNRIISCTALAYVTTDSTPSETNCVPIYNELTSVNLFMIIRDCKFPQIAKTGHKQGTIWCNIANNPTMVGSIKDNVYHSRFTVAPIKGTNVVADNNSAVDITSL